MFVKRYETLYSFGGPVILWKVLMWIQLSSSSLMLHLLTTWMTSRPAPDEIIFIHLSENGCLFTTSKLVVITENWHIGGFSKMVSFSPGRTILAYRCDYNPDKRRILLWAAAGLNITGLLDWYKWGRICVYALIHYESILSRSCGVTWI